MLKLELTLSTGLIYHLGTLFLFNKHLYSIYYVPSTLVSFLQPEEMDSVGEKMRQPLNSLGLPIFSEKAMAPHSSTLAWTDLDSLTLKCNSIS